GTQAAPPNCSGTVAERARARPARTVGCESVTLTVLEVAGDERLTGPRPALTPRLTASDQWLDLAAEAEHGAERSRRHAEPSTQSDHRYLTRADRHVGR